MFMVITTTTLLNINMIINRNILQKCTLKLKAALLLIERISTFNIKLSIGKKQSFDSIKEQSIDNIFVGVDNVLSGHRADFDSKKIELLIKKAQSNPSFPKNIKLKKLAKGYQLFTQKQKDNGNHNNDTDK